MDPLPQYLYRVQFPSCNTVWTSEGLSAGDHISSPLAKDYLCDHLRSIEEHFLRDERLPTPYISLFSNREHAELWALRLTSTPDIKLLKISTRRLAHTKSKILRLTSVMKVLGVNAPSRAREYEEDAYLVSHAIPAQAVVDVRDRQGIEFGAFDTLFRHVCADFFGSAREEDAQARKGLYAVLARAEITTNVGETFELLSCQREYAKLVRKEDWAGAEDQSLKAQDLIFSMMARAKVTMTVGEVLKMLAMAGEGAG